MHRTHPITHAVITLIGASVLAVSFLSVRHRMLESEARAYAEASIRTIAQTWNIRDLQRHTSPAFLTAFPPGSLEHMLATWRRLGPLKAYYPTANGSTINADLHGPAAVRYTGPATFQGGPAEVSISVAQDQTAWRITSLYIEPAPALRRP